MKILKNILLVLVIITIILGIVMIKVKGFNYGLLYSTTQRMNIYIDKELDINSIKDIAKEILGEDILVQYGTHFNTVASVVAREITEEQQDTIISKIQEKLEVEINKDEDVVLMDIPQANVYDLISIYILPIILILALFLIFLEVRYRKQGAIKTILIPGLSVILVLGLYISAYSIVRIPVNDFFVIFAMLFFIGTLITNTMILNRAEEKIN